MVGTRVGVGSAFGLQPMSKLKTNHAIIDPEGNTSNRFEILKSCSFQIFSSRMCNYTTPSVFRNLSWQVGYVSVGEIKVSSTRYLDASTQHVAASPRLAFLLAHEVDGDVSAFEIVLKDQSRLGAPVAG
jgi:hypothetical protein